MRQTHTQVTSPPFFFDIGAYFIKYVPAVKDEDSDMDVLDDGGSDSDMEESRPSKPRPTRNGIMAGTLTRRIIEWNII